MPKLTSKQISFCDAIISGLNQTDAYKAAYDTENMLPATISNNAYMLMNHSDITANIKAQRDSILASVTLTKERAITEAMTNLSMARNLDQIGPANQSLKLAAELARPSTGRTLYVLDEPTTGLHLADIKQLLLVIHRLTDSGNTVIIIEHNMDVIKTADHLIDLGPEGGDAGGQIVATGTPEEVAQVTASHTGRILQDILQKNPIPI